MQLSTVASVAIVPPLRVTAGDIVEQCAWCGAVRADLGWEDAGIVIVQHIGPYSVSHGICPSCFEKVKAAYMRHPGASGLRCCEL